MKSKAWKITGTVVGLAGLFALGWQVPSWLDRGEVTPAPGEGTVAGTQNAAGAP